MGESAPKRVQGADFLVSKAAEGTQRTYDCILSIRPTRAMSDERKAIADLVEQREIAECTNPRVVLA